MGLGHVIMSYECHFTNSTIAFLLSEIHFSFFSSILKMCVKEILNSCILYRLDISLNWICEFTETEAKGLVDIMQEVSSVMSHEGSLIWFRINHDSSSLNKQNYEISCLVSNDNFQVGYGSVFMWILNILPRSH